MNKLYNIIKLLELNTNKINWNIINWENIQSETLCLLCLIDKNKIPLNKLTIEQLKSILQHSELEEFINKHYYNIENILSNFNIDSKEYIKYNNNDNIINKYINISNYCNNIIISQNCSLNILNKNLNYIN